MVKQNINNSFNILNLDSNATLEQVKSTYKQLALKTHPDKNPDNPEATAKFQELGEAYSTLLKHFDRQASAGNRGYDVDDDDEDYGHFGHSHSHSHSPFGFPGFGFNPYANDYGEYDADDVDDGYGGYDSDDDYEERMDFYMFLFEELMGGRMHGARFNHSRMPRAKAETHEEFQDRTKRAREEAVAAQERRASEDKARKERRAREAIEEARRAADRKKAKAQDRVRQHAESISAANTKVKEALERRQKLRSAAFAAARKGDAKAVKKAVWEDSVDAAGSETLPGCEIPGKADQKETLLHIAVQGGDKDLVEWLVDHSAEPEERDSKDQTAFHRALVKGNTPIIEYFLENFPPQSEESAPVLGAPAGDTILRLAVSSATTSIVYAVLDAGLVDLSEVGASWQWIDDIESGKIKNQIGSKTQWTKVRQVLREIEGWTPPATPSTTPVLKSTEIPSQPTDSNSTSPPSPTFTPIPPKTKTKTKTPYSKKFRAKQESSPLDPPAPRDSKPNAKQPPFISQPQQPRTSNPSRSNPTPNPSPNVEGSPRGRSGYRGRGRGRGRGAPPQAV